MGNMLDMSIHEYAEAGDLEGMRLYVEAGGNVKKRDFFNNTALHRSASMGFTAITGYLLESGAEVDAVANDGWTPLHLACRWGRVGAIKALVQAGADVKKTTNDGRIPAELLKVEMSPRDRNEALKLLGSSPSVAGFKHASEVGDE
ncbi:unnamed protein product [Ectocarpus sp. CCAP 1310/34]|nr:unnamed protein product [Ectocarpus sp. CCAP 1310/34]